MRGLDLRLLVRLSMNGCNASTFSLYYIYVIYIPIYTGHLYTNKIIYVR